MHRARGVVLDQIEHRQQMMHDVLDPITTVEAVRHVVATSSTRTRRADDAPRARSSRSGTPCACSGSQISLNGILSVKQRLPGSSSPDGFGAREVVVPEQVAAQRWSAVQALRQVVGERLGSWEQLAARACAARRRTQLAARAHRGVAREHLLDQRRAGARETHDEDRLRHVGAHGRARQQLERCRARRTARGAQKTLRRPARLIAQSAAPRRRACALPSTKSRQASSYRPSAIEQPPAFEPPIAIERGGGLDDRERLRVAPGARQELRPQQIDVAWRPPPPRRGRATPRREPDRPRTSCSFDQ